MTEAEAVATLTAVVSSELSQLRSEVILSRQTVSADALQLATIIGPGVGVLLWLLFLTVMWWLWKGARFLLSFSGLVKARSI